MKINIIGGGIIGCSAAYHLSKMPGVSVTVFEYDPGFTQSSFARSCGGLRSQFFTDTNVEMSRYSIDFIKNETDVKFTGNGYLMLFGDDQQKDHDHSLKLQKKYGATTISLDKDELKEKHPYMYRHDIYRGCITVDQSEGWIDPVELHRWFRNNAKENGVLFEAADGTAVYHGDADYIIIAAGCWSGKVGRKYGLDIPVKGHKHTVFNVTTEKPQLANLPLVADLITGIYLRPEGEGYIVGYDGNGDWNSEDLEPDYNSWDTIWELLFHRFPAIFDAAKMQGAWSGYYDASTIDNNAIIDYKDNFYFATGFTGRGLMHSPAVGLTLSQMILGENLSFDINGYKLDRKPNVEKYVI